MSDVLPPDPVSPEPPKDSSPSEPQQTGATPPVADGRQAAPPAERSPAPAAESDDGVPVIGEGDVLDRLSSGKSKQDAPPEPAAAKPADAAPTEPAAEKTPDAESEDDTPTEEDVQPPSKEELDGMHSKTRRRIKGFMQRIDAMQPYAEFGSDLLERAHAAQMDVKTLDSWVEAGLRLKQGDPEAMELVANILVKRGWQPPANEAPTVDRTRVDDVLDLLASSGEITEAAKSHLAKALDTAIPKVAPKPVTAAPPAPAAPQRQAPAQPSVSPYEQARAQAQALVAEARGEYQARAAGNWTKVEPEIVKELQTMEAKLAPQIRDDPRRWPARYAQAAERVLLRLSSRPAQPPVQSALRPGGGTPPPPAKLVPGTPEYEDALLSGKIAV